MTDEQECQAMTGASSYAPAAPPPSLQNNAVETYKQQLQEMEIRLKTVWSQKEAFRQANERLSREIRRVQGQNTARARQALVQSLQASPSKQGPARGNGLQRTSGRFAFRPSSRQFSGRPIDCVASAASKAALPACCDKGCVASPIAAFAAPPSGHASSRFLEKQDNYPAREHHAESGGASHGRKIFSKGCSTVDSKALQPSLQDSRFFRVKSGSQTQRGSSNSDRDCMNITCAPGYIPAPIDGPPSQRALVTSKFPRKESNACFYPYNQGRRCTLPANSPHPLPAVPRLDLNGVLRLQQRAAGGLVAFARSSPCAVNGQTDLTAPDHPACSGQKRRLSSSQHGSSSGRSLAGAETTRDSAHCGHFGHSKDCEFPSVHRDSVTTQESLCIGKGVGSSMHMYRRTVTRENYEDGVSPGVHSLAERGQGSDSVLHGRACIDSGGCPLGEERTTGSRQRDAQEKAVFDGRCSLSVCPSERACRQRTVRQNRLHLDSYMPLQGRPVCVAGASWKPMLSTRSAVGGPAQRERAFLSARPSLAETALKTPCTCFLDDKIVRASHAVRSSVSGSRDPFLPPRFTAADAFVSRSTIKNIYAVEKKELESAQHSNLVPSDKECGGLSVEEQLTLHVRHCMELLHCTDGRREEDLKAADISRTISKTAHPAMGKPCRKEEAEGGERGKCTGDYGSSLLIPSSTSVFREGPLVSEAAEDSTLQACVRKPRDGYWHVIYTCVLKVRGTDFFLDVRYAGTAIEGKKCESARLVASKEQAGVFRVCIRHLLRSARDFFDSARILWWQPLPVVYSEDWLPYDEVMCMRADTQIRALRAKHPALAAAAHAREKRNTKAAEAASEEGTRITGLMRQEPGNKRCSVRRRERDHGRYADSTHSPFPTGRTARLVARNVNQYLYQAGRADTSGSGSSFHLQCHRRSLTERTLNKATADNIPASAVTEAKAKRESETHRDSVSSFGRDSIREERGVCSSATEEEADLPSRMKKASVSSNLCPPPPRHYSEWDAVGLVYVGSLCADQPVAQFKRILGSCNSNIGEPGGWYLTCPKSKPRCMMLSPSSDMSFLLSAPLTRSSSCSSDNSCSSVNSARSSYTAATSMSKDSERPQTRETQNSSKSDGSSTSKVTLESVERGQDRDSPRRTQDDFSSVFSDTSAAGFCGPRSTRVVERTCSRYDEECSCDNNAFAIKRKDSYCSSSSSGSSRSSKIKSTVSISSGCRSCCSIRSSNDKWSRTEVPVLSSSATSLGLKRRPRTVQTESAKAAFDTTCQVSLSRKLGLQELFIVRRSDRENGCFPLYHYSSGRYLCAHATNGLVGMLCANATPAAARAANAVQKEIKASRRLAAEANRAEVGDVSKFSTVRGSTAVHSQPLRKSSDYGGKASSLSGHSSSMVRKCLSDATFLKKTLERRRTVRAAKPNTSCRMRLEKDLDRKGQVTAGSVDTGRFTQRLSDASLTPLTACPGDPCASAAYFPTSPFFLSRLAHQSNQPSSQDEPDTSPCCSDRGGTWATDQVVRGGEPISTTDMQYTDAGDMRESEREAAKRKSGESTQQAEAKQNTNSPLEDSVSQENTRVVAVYDSQKGERKLGALTVAKRLKPQRKPLIERFDTSSLATSGDPSTTTTPLEPSFFELVTVSDLLVQQTVARILAAVPQPPTVTAAFQEEQNTVEESSHYMQDREAIGRVDEEAEASIPLANAEFSKGENRRPLRVNKVGQSLKLEETKQSALTERVGTSGRVIDNRTYAKKPTLGGETESVCDPENPAEAGKAKAAACSHHSGEYKRTLTSLRILSSSSKRNRRKSDSTSRSAATIDAAIPLSFPNTYTVSNGGTRNSLPARKNHARSQNVPLMLPYGAGLATMNSERADVVRGPSMRMRRKSTYEAQTHTLERTPQQQPFVKHRQQPRRPRLPPRERFYFTAVGTNSAKTQPLHRRRGCERFCLDDCDALTEIASDEIPARRT